MAEKENTMKQIMTTSNYDKFILIQGNRQIKHVKKVKAAMEKEDLMDVFPVVCSKAAGGKLKILDGQGRVEAAKQLGLPVRYVVTDKIREDMIGSINSVQTSWSTKNYVDWYADNGHPSYVELRKFINDTGIPVTVAVQLVTGSIGDGGMRNASEVRNGDITVSNMKHAYKVANVIYVLKKHGIRFATHRSLVLALHRLCKTESFDIERLDKKLEYQTGKFVKCAEYMQYIQMIDDIYNYRASGTGIVSLTTEVKRNGE